MASSTPSPAGSSAADAAAVPAEPAHPAGNPTADRHLTRSLTHGQMAMIAMGSALGTGLFLGSGAAIEIAGPAVIVSFAIGAAIAGTLALTMGEMATRHPVAGGFGTLAAHYLSPFWGYLARWLYWVVTVAVTAAELVACAAYLIYWLPGMPPWLGIVLFAALIIGINLSAVGSFGRVEFVLSGIKVIAVSVFILVGLFLVFVGTSGAPAPGLDLFTADGGFAPNGATAIWVALGVVMFSFGGVELLSITAAEAKDPGRSVRMAAQTTMVRLALFYILSIGIVVALTSWRDAAGTGSDVAASPFVLVFERIGIDGAAHVTNAVVLIAALSAANANLYASSRMMHSLAADHFAPAALATTTRRGVPLRGVAASSIGILVAAVLAFSEVAGIFGYLMSLVVFSLMAVWALILVTYIAFRRAGERSPVFTAPGGIGLAVAGLVGVAAVFATAIALPSLRLATLVGVPAVAVLGVLWVAVVRHRMDPADVERAFREADVATGTALALTDQDPRVAEAAVGARES